MMHTQASPIRPIVTAIYLSVIITEMNSGVICMYFINFYNTLWEAKGLVVINYNSGCYLRSLRFSQTSCMLYMQCQVSFICTT